MDFFRIKTADCEVRLRRRRGCQTLPNTVDLASDPGRQIMQERRLHARRKTFFGGRVVFAHRHATMDCVVKNMGERGAKLVFHAPTILPEEFDVQVVRLARAFRGRVIWRGGNELGISFAEEDGSAKVVPLDYAAVIRKLKAEKAKLEQRVTQLSSAE
jgi:hypothetical protein